MEMTVSEKSNRALAARLCEERIVKLRAAIRLTPSICEVAEEEIARLNRCIKEMGV
jgi:hypothetical protein